MKTMILCLATFGFILQMSAVLAHPDPDTWDDIEGKEGFCRSYGTKGVYQLFRVSLHDCKEKCSIADAEKYCTGIEYHEDTRRCEIHYWDITSVESLEGKRRYGKVKCYEVCKGTGCFNDRGCYEKIGDGECQGVSNGGDSYQSDVNKCFRMCRETSGCKSYEYDWVRKRCKTFGDLASSAQLKRGKICFMRNDC